MNLIKEVKKLREKNKEIKKKVDLRLKEFSSFDQKSPKSWFSELCFCLLTANSKARTAIQIQKELGSKGFCSACAKDVKKCIIKNKHRFHNNKTDYIVAAREHVDVKNKIVGIIKQNNDYVNGQREAREWLVKNIKGLGYKEASHFLRNVGYFDLAILDRHIINLMLEEGIIKDKPKTLTKKKYLEYEDIFFKLAKKMKMSCAELDLYMWYLKGGDVLK